LWFTLVAAEGPRRVSERRLQRDSLLGGTVMAKNYYAILGILPTATLAEIRSAYRRRAKQYHPDQLGRDSAPFLNVQEAYDVLSNPANRSLYDRSLRKPGAGGVPHTRPVSEVIRSRKPPVEPLKSSRGPLDLGTISPLRSFHTFGPSFDEIFDALGNTFDLRSQPKADRFRTLTMEVLLTPEQARRGGSVWILLPAQVACPTCGGRGDTGFYQCWRCDGTGVSLEELPLQVEYPPGIQDHYQVAIPLDRFGIHDICPILLFRISIEGDFEDL
jgi:molecular chaperone DnaJ